MLYNTYQQQHLYHHARGFCQPETMEFLNHSIEFVDGLCHSCLGTSAIKIIGVNRLVCLRCQKAHCYICTAEVSPDGGRLLSFIPGYCHLFSMSSTFEDINKRKNQKECQICDDIHRKFPEYQLYLEVRSEITLKMVVA